MNRRKELQQQYKQRPVIGGVYCIRNTQTGRCLLQQTTDIAGSKNRLDFARITNDCPMHQLKEDWNTFGAASFAFEEKEKLEKKAEQTNEEFRKDLQALLEMWQESPEEPLQY
ncbi:GIY-YIG nuclease family protein [Ruminococcaceae bacterium OttesenSCG-928-A16]|nr:GIY-YIG nuclease family protein [Ruminococcaceae bacterium OttesenSCG-928-A16]